MVNLAFLIQSLYLGLLPSLAGKEMVDVLTNPWVRFFTGLLPLMASLLIMAFVIIGRRAARRKFRGGIR